MNNLKKVMFGSLLLVINGLICFIISNTSSEHILLSTFAVSLPFCLLYLKFYSRMFSSTFFFICFYLMLFYIQPIVYFLTGGTYNSDLQLVKTMAFLLISGLHLFMLGNLIFTNKAVTQPSVEIEMRKIRKVTNRTLFLTLACVVALFVDAGTFNILSLSRMDLKNAGSLLRLMATYGLYLTSVLFFLVFFTVKKRSNFNILCWIIFVIVFEFLIFLFFRTRSMTVVHLSAVLVGYYYSHYYYAGEARKHTSKKVKALTFALVIGCLAIVMRFFRGYLQPSSNVSEFRFGWQGFLKTSVENGDLGYSGIVLKVISLVPNTYDYFHGQSYLRMLFIFIPRSLWEAKPINTETIVGQWLYPGAAGMSIPPGVSGDLYLNFGIAGVIFMVLFGVFFSLLDKRMTLSNFMLWAVSATWIYHLVRGGFTNPILIFLVLLVYIKLNSRVFFRDTTQQRQQPIYNVQMNHSAQ